MKLPRIALALEVLLCYLPLLVVIVIAVGAAPAAVIALLAGEIGMIAYLLLVSMLVAGMIGVLYVLRWLIVPSAQFADRRLVLTLLCVGALPLVLAFAFSVGVVFKLVVGAPVVCGAHLSYLARDYLFPRTATGEP